jgi:hypothetical protein
MDREPVRLGVLQHERAFAPRVRLRGATRARGTSCLQGTYSYDTSLLHRGQRVNREGAMLPYSVPLDYRAFGPIWHSSSMPQDSHRPSGQREKQTHDDVCNAAEPVCVDAQRACPVWIELLQPVSALLSSQVDDDSPGSHVSLRGTVRADEGKQHSFKTPLACD